MSPTVWPGLQVVGEVDSENSTPCHLLVLHMEALKEKMGSYWLLDRKRTLLSLNTQILSMFLECLPYVAWSWPPACVSVRVPACC